MVLGAVHLKHITDLAWSPCGHFLAASSHDGYCTIAHFEADELGVPLKGDAIPDPLAVRQDMQLQRQTKVCDTQVSVSRSELVGLLTDI